MPRITYLILRPLLIINMKINQHKNHGFTLIELVIVISIIAVLGAAIISIINPFEIQRSSRDSVRVSNLNSISQALELYFAQNKSYPSTLDDATKTALAVFNSRISWSDPSGCTVTYEKTSDGYKLYLPQESASFNVPTGQALISIVDKPASYSCTAFTFTKVIQIYVKQ